MENPSNPSEKGAIFSTEKSHQSTAKATAPAPAPTATIPSGDSRPAAPPLLPTTLAAPTAASSITNSSVGSKAGAAGPSWRRAGKEPFVDDRTDEERKPIIVNLAQARGTARARLLAVGVFLSVIAISSKQLVSYMKNVWKIKGSLESNQLADRRFVLEFSSEGDFEHVTKGGPWRYQGDAVLIRKLEEREDPNDVRFESVPIWAQFTRIPYYLLSKQLARNLGMRLGGFICIDNNARGDIGDKILRARVHLPVARALQRWMTLEDEFSGEEVIVAVLYEHLPTFCLTCGVIGHKEDACDLPAVLRRRRYSKELGVLPTPTDDQRKWYLAETAGENGRALQMDAPWRNVALHGARRPSAPATQLAMVAHVAKGVEKLTVQEGTNGTSKTKHVTSPGNKAEDEGSIKATPPVNTTAEPNAATVV